MSIETYETRAIKMLVARLIEEENRRANSIVNGSPETLEEYREQVGFLRGLKFARECCGAVETDLRKGQ